jgi:hypothetical protein
VSAVETSFVLRVSRVAQEDLLQQVLLLVTGVVYNDVRADYVYRIMRTLVLLVANLGATKVKSCGFLTV